MKKTVSILLCLVLLLSCVGIFSSCSKYTGTPEVSKKVVELDLTGYELTYFGDISNVTQQEIKDFAKLFQQKTGVAIKASKAASDGSATPGNQILVGTLSCEPTEKALKGIKGHGWTIRVIDNNIVIVGTTQIFTNIAIDYFIEHYLQVDPSVKTKNPVISVNKQVVLDKVPTVDVVSGETYNYTFVYSDELDDEPGWQHVIPGNHSGGNSKDDIDFPVALAKENLPTAVAKALKLKGAPAASSDITVNEKEILVGITNRAEGYEAMKTLSTNQYALYVRGSKIILGAWNDEALDFASQMFQVALEDGRYTNEDGVKSIVFPADYTDVGTVNINWVTDFPKPEGENISLAGTLSSADDSLVYAYQGAGVTADAFDAYCEKLKDNGYKLVQSNTIDKNKFATYKNTTDNVTLHVEYAAYQNAADMTYSYNLAGQYIEDFTPTLRVTSAPLSSVVLPTEELLDSTANTKADYMLDSMITQVDVNYAAGDKGMFYIITLEDGTFIVVDGATNKNGLDDKLWTMLKNLYKKAHGYEATQKDSIHIRAWLMTHEHSDHYSVMLSFLKDYGKNDLLRFDYLIGNFTSETQDYNAMQPSHAVYNALDELKSYCPVGEAFKYIKVHTGQKLYIQNVMLEVLFTHQDMAPSRQPFFNDTSTIFKTTIYNTNGWGIVESEETLMILGDAGLIGSTFLRGMYSEATLDVNQVQVAHHGGFGCEKELYTLLSPTVTWWALDAATTNSTCNPDGKNQGLEYIVGRYLMNELEGHKYAYIADGYSTTLVISDDGPLYNKLYDANFDFEQAENITYDNNSVIDVTARRGN